MCISFEDHIYLQKPNETWTAEVYNAGDLGKTDEEQAYLYTQAVKYATSKPDLSEAANWAAWELGDPSLVLTDYFSKFSTEYADITDDLNNAEGLTTQLAEYANYLIYVPTTDGYSGDTDDKTPQTFVGAPAPTPEPSSLVLLGSGLLTAAGALYRRKKQLTA